MPKRGTRRRGKEHRQPADSVGETSKYVEDFACRSEPPLVYEEHESKKRGKRAAGLMAIP